MFEPQAQLSVTLTPRPACVSLAQTVVDGQISSCSERLRPDGTAVYVRDDGWWGPQLTTRFQTPLNPELMQDRTRQLVDDCPAYQGAADSVKPSTRRGTSLSFSS